MDSFFFYSRLHKVALLSWSGSCTYTKLIMLTKMQPLNQSHSCWCLSVSTRMNSFYLIHDVRTEQDCLVYWAALLNWKLRMQSSLCSQKCNLSICFTLAMRVSPLNTDAISFARTYVHTYSRVSWSWHHDFCALSLFANSERRSIKSKVKQKKN